MKEDKAKLFVKKSECSVKTCAHFLKEVLKKRKIPISGVYSSESKKDTDFARACELTEEFANDIC